MDTPTKTVVDVEQLRKAAAVPLQTLSNQTGIPRNSLRRKLANPDTFTVAEFSKVATALNIPDDMWWVAS